MTDHEGPGSRSFADRLSHLREHAHPAGRGPFTNMEIATGTGLSKTYIDNLFGGKQDNPTRSVIGGLARFFGVKPGYFFDDDVAAQTDADLARAVALAAALQNRNVERFALRAASLDPTIVAALIEMVERLPTSPSGPAADAASEPAGDAPRRNDRPARSRTAAQRGRPEGGPQET